MIVSETFKKCANRLQLSMLEYSSGSVMELEPKPDAELELPKFSQNYTLTYLDLNFAVQNSERIQLKFIVTLHFSCSKSIQQLNNRSTQIIFFSEFHDIIVPANGSQRSSASSAASLSLSLFMVFRKISNL